MQKAKTPWWQKIWAKKSKTESSGVVKELGSLSNEPLLEDTQRKWVRSGGWLESVQEGFKWTLIDGERFKELGLSLNDLPKRQQDVVGWWIEEKMERGVGQENKEAAKVLKELQSIIEIKPKTVGGIVEKAVEWTDKKFKFWNEHNLPSDKIAALWLKSVYRVVEILEDAEVLGVVDLGNQKDLKSYWQSVKQKPTQHKSEWEAWEHSKNRIQREMLEERQEAWNWDCLGIYPDELTEMVVQWKADEVKTQQELQSVKARWVRNTELLEAKWMEGQISEDIVIKKARAKSVRL